MSWKNKTKGISMKSLKRSRDILRTGLVIIILMTGLNVYAQKTNLSLSEAIQRTLDNNYGIVIGKEDANIAEISNNWGTAGRLPSIGFTASSNNNVDLEIPEPQISIRPNPSNGQYSFTVNGLNDWINMSVVNSQGKVVLEKRKLFVQETYSGKIDLADLPKGFYFLHLAGEQSRWNRKLIKE